LVAKIHYSNRVESLIDSLGNQLYRDCDPLARRLVLFPSGAMRDYAQRELASSLGILMGVELLDLTTGLTRLVDWSGQRPSPDGIMPGLKELALGIEYEINQINDPSLAEWRRESRVSGLSLELSTLFRLYSTYGTEMVHNWRKEGGGWQGEVWRKLFYERGHGWTHDQHLLQAVELAIEIATQQGEHSFPKTLQIHFFSWSFFPKRHLDLFLALGNLIETHFYFLSPTEMYWGDIQSDRERRRITSLHLKKGVVEDQVMELDLFLRERNPLLANFGKMGREMIKTIEGHQAITEESYRVTQGVVEREEYQDYFVETELMERTERPLTILEAVQADLLFLRNPYSIGEEKPKIAINESESIQIHIADSKRREVEVLYDQLIALLQTKKIDPQNVIVMAPEIKEYIPYIHQVFGSDSSEIPYQAMDLSAASQSPLMRGFLLLLNLESTRWNITNLFELLTHPSFKISQKWGEEERRILMEWVERCGIHWGLDSNHRSELLTQTVHITFNSYHQGTWEEGFSRLLESLTTPFGTLDKEIETSNWELLGEMIDLIRSLHADLKPILKAHTKTISDWREYFNTLFSRYFIMNEEEIERVEGLLRNLSTTSPILTESQFPFSSIKVHIESILAEEDETFQKSQLHGIRFCSMRPMRAIPADCLILMGMNDGAFPRQEVYRNLNLLWSEGSGDYCPSRSDFDRYLFLEALLSARKYLIITYQGYQDGVESPPALPVRELIRYIDEAYELNDPFTHRHPHHAYDRKAFLAGKGTLRNYSLAKAREGAHIESHRPWSGESNYLSAETDPIQLSDLILLAKDPIRYYLRSKFNIYWKEDIDLIEDEPLLIPKIKMGELRKLALTHKAGKVIDHASNRGWLPTGLPGKEACYSIEKEVEAIHTLMNKYGIPVGEVWTLELKPNCDRPEQLSASHWIVQGPISGTITNVTAKGILSLGTNEHRSILKELPIYLALKEIDFPMVEKSILTIQEEGIFKESSVCIADYLAYQKRASQTMSPLLPSWIPHLVSKKEQLDQVDCHKNIHDPYFFYPAAKWALDPIDQIPAEVLFGPWIGEINGMFSAISQEWFPGGKSGE
jgi:exodeoxyribonuclease V gamma subunit